MQKTITTYYCACFLLAINYLPLTAAAQTSFAPAATYTPGGNHFYKVAVGDLNADGKPDIAAANTDTSVGVLLGDGTGKFSTAITYSTGTNGNYYATSPYDIALGDINKDSKLDAVTSNSDGSISVLFGTGNGGFAAASVYQMEANSQPQNIVLGDINNDGSLDIALADINISGKILVLLNDTRGRFTTPITYDLGNYTQPTDVALQDVNGDGKLDVLTISGTPFGMNQLAVMLNNGTGSFLPAVTYAIGNTINASYLAVGDVNGDGKLDVVTTNTDNGTVSVLINNGSGAFPSAVVYSGRLGAADLIGSLALKDVNGDRKLDIAVPNQSRGIIKILLNDGTGTFTSLPTTFPTESVSSHPYSALLADLNADGKADIVTTNYRTNNIGVLLNTSSNPLAVAPAVNKATVALYPNPAQTASTIELPYVAGFTHATLHLDDILGRTASTASIPLGKPYSLDLHGVKSGVYFLRFQIGESVTVEKLVVK
jgi:uncharacterized protein (DUF2141 family)